jgi:hypothetical protein
MTATITPSAYEQLQIKIRLQNNKAYLRWLLGWQQSKTLLQKNSLPRVFVIGREAGCSQKSGDKNRLAAIIIKVSCIICLSISISLISKCRKITIKILETGEGGVDIWSSTQAFSFKSKPNESNDYKIIVLLYLNSPR